MILHPKHSKVKTERSGLISYSFLMLFQNQTFCSQNYNKNMIAFSETFTVKRCKNITSVIIQGSLQIRSNNNTNLELAVQSQQTVTLITDTIKKP